MTGCLRATSTGDSCLCKRCAHETSEKGWPGKAGNLCRSQELLGARPLRRRIVQRQGADGPRVSPVGGAAAPPRNENETGCNTNTQKFPQPDGVSASELAKNAERGPDPRDNHGSAQARCRLWRLTSQSACDRQLQCESRVEDAADKTRNAHLQIMCFASLIFLPSAPVQLCSCRCRHLRCGLDLSDILRLLRSPTTSARRKSLRPNRASAHLGPTSHYLGLLAWFAAASEGEPTAQARACGDTHAPPEIIQRHPLLEVDLQ